MPKKLIYIFIIPLIISGFIATIGYIFGGYFKDIFETTWQVILACFALIVILILSKRFFIDGMK